MRRVSLFQRDLVVDNNIGIEGARKLCESLRDNTLLTSLNLEGINRKLYERKDSDNDSFSK